ncbi:hypothetical protein JCM3766R1_003764 [Sporobolomyces carnicolor]
MAPLRWDIQMAQDAKLAEVKRRIETAFDAVFTEAAAAHLDEATKEILREWESAVRDAFGLGSYDKLNKALLQDLGMEWLLSRIMTLSIYSRRKMRFRDENGWLPYFQVPEMVRVVEAFSASMAPASSKSLGVVPTAFNRHFPGARKVR